MLFCSFEMCHCASPVGLRVQALTSRWDLLRCFNLFHDTLPVCFWNFVFLCIDDLSFETEKEHLPSWYLEVSLCHVSLLSLILGSKSSEVVAGLAQGRGDVIIGLSQCLLATSTRLFFSRKNLPHVEIYFCFLRFLRCVYYFLVVFPTSLRGSIWHSSYLISVVMVMSLPLLKEYQQCLP